MKFMDLVDEAAERGRRLVADRSPNLPDDDVDVPGRAIGLGALKYAELSNDRIKDYAFGWDRTLAFDGNTAPYLQYAHARIHSLLNRAANSPIGLHGSAFHILTRRGTSTRADQGKCIDSAIAADAGVRSARWQHLRCRSDSPADQHGFGDLKELSVLTFMSKLDIT
jgi:arginyl-tRNA synthetase